MATIRPFKGLRPLPHLAAQVASRPYDVLSSEEARKEAEGKPLSFLHIGKPEIDLSPGTNPYDESVYQKGKENLQKLITDGIMREDPSPSLYLYALTMDNQTQYGLVACVSVAEYLNDTIKKHELTRNDKEDDRTKHITVTNAHTGPILVAYRAQSAIDAMAERVRSSPPVNDFFAGDEIRHQLWVIDDQKVITEIIGAFGRVKNLYVADGHHRSAAAARVAKKLADANPNHRGDEQYNFFPAVLFPHNQLHIMDYNRVVRDLNDRTPAEYLEEVKKYFAVNAGHSPVRPAAKSELGMYLEGRWYHLKIKPELLHDSDPVERLDVSVLQRRLLAPVLGIHDPRTDKRIDFVGGIRGLKELERRVNSGEMAVAFSLYPTSIEELLAIADAGKIMPPKSTWFEPKLRDGLIVHMLE